VSPQLSPRQAPGDKEPTPLDEAKKIAAQAVDRAQDALAAADAALENAKLIGKLPIPDKDKARGPDKAPTKPDDKKPKLKKTLNRACKSQSAAAAALQYAMDVEGEILEAYEDIEMIEPAAAEGMLDAARKAAKESEEAAHDGEAAEQESAGDLEAGIADVPVEDLRPKALHTAKLALEEATKAKAHAGSAHNLCQKARDLLPELPEEALPQAKKDDVLEKADREDKHAADALEDAIAVTGVAEQVPIDCKEDEKVRPAYVAAVQALSKGEKANKEARQAHEKAKKLLKDVKDLRPIDEMSVMDLAKDAREKAMEAINRADKVEHKAEKATDLANAAPEEQKPQADVVLEKAAKTEEAAKAAEDAAKEALDKLDELEKVAKEAKEHPELAPTLIDLAKAARELADKADKLADVAEQLAEDLELALHSAIAPPQLGDADLGLEPEIPLIYNLPPSSERPLEDVKLDLDKLSLLEELEKALKKEAEMEKALEDASKDASVCADKLENALNKEDDAKRNAEAAKEDAEKHPTPEAEEQAEKADEKQAEKEEEALLAKLEAGKARSKAAEARSDAELARAKVAEIKLRIAELENKAPAAEPLPEEGKEVEALEKDVKAQEVEAEKEYKEAMEKLDRIHAYKPSLAKPKTPTAVLLADKRVRDLEDKLEDALDEVKAAEEALARAKDEEEKAKDLADDLAEEAKKNPTPENIAAAKAAEDALDAYDEATLLAKIRAGEAQATADDILHDLEQAKADLAEEKTKEENAQNPDALEPPADKLQEFEELVEETENAEVQAAEEHRVAIQKLKKAKDYRPGLPPKKKPSKIEEAKKIADKAQPIAQEAAEIAADALDKAKLVEALGGEKPPAAVEALRAKNLANVAQQDLAKVDQDVLAALTGEPITPEKEDEVLDDAKKADKEANEALQAAKQALADCTKALEGTPISPEDLLPKIKHACKVAHKKATHARKREPKTKSVAEKAREIIAPLECPSEIKEEVAKLASGAEKDADRAVADADKADKQASKVLEECADEAKVEPPLLVEAVEAMNKGNKAAKKARHAEKKAIKALKLAKDQLPATDPQALIDEAKREGGVAHDQAEKAHQHAAKARKQAVPFSPQVAEEIQELANKAEEAAVAADKAVEELENRAAEAQPVVDESKEHPSKPDLALKALDVAKEVSKLGRTAEELGDLAEKALEDLKRALENATPLLFVEPEDHKHPDAFPCPFCQNPHWNWPEILQKTQGVEDMSKLTKEEELNKQLAALQAARKKLKEMEEEILKEMEQRGITPPKTTN